MQRLESLSRLSLTCFEWTGARIDMPESPEREASSARP